MIKSGYNDQPRNPKMVAIVDRWSFIIGHFYCLTTLEMESEIE